MADPADIDLNKFIQACEEAAGEYDVDTLYLVSVAGIESEIRNVGTPGSSAFGPFQILTGTWAEYMAADGFTEADRMDPLSQPFVAAHIASDGIAALRKVIPDRAPTNPELYLTHLFGAGGGAKFLAGARTTPAADAIATFSSDPQKIIAVNRSLLTAGDGTVQAVLDEVEKRMKAALARFLPANFSDDPELPSKLVAHAVDSTRTSYWVVERTGNDVGGEFLIRQKPETAPEIIAADTTVFPIQAGLIPKDVIEQLSANVPPPAAETPVAVAPASPGEDINQRVLTAARNSASGPGQLHTGDAAGTNHGRLACAFAVNTVVKRALGSPVGGGLSTAEMFKVLKARDQQVTEPNIAGGEIVISPTTGSNVGHVGILDTASQGDLATTKIFSNSSKRAEFEQNFTLASWKKYFNGKGLPVLFFALNKDRFPGAPTPAAKTTDPAPSASGGTAGGGTGPVGQTGAGVFNPQFNAFFTTLVPGGFFSADPNFHNSSDPDDIRNKRSVRTNNPGALNISPWQRTRPGFVDVTKDDGQGNVTSIYSAPEYGIAAWYHLLSDRYGFAAAGGAFTINQLARRYAGSDAAQSKVDNYVSAWCTLADTPLNGQSVVHLSKDDEMLNLARAMFKNECGKGMPLSNAQILFAIQHERNNTLPPPPKSAS